MEKEMEIETEKVEEPAVVTPEPEKKKSATKKTTAKKVAPKATEESTPVEVSVDTEEKITHSDDTKNKKTAKKTEETPTSVEASVEALVNENQMNVLKIALGWNESNIPRVPDKAPKGVEVKPVLYSYRNRFFTDPKPQLDDLVQKGLMEPAQFGTSGVTHTGYKVTEKGIAYVSEVTNTIIKIKNLRG